MQHPFTYDTGVIHGRFQVLHNDHLRYLLAGKSLCRHLVVGITNPDPFMVKPEATDAHRSDPLANPLTYYERYVMLRTALTACAVAWHDFSIVPFPINLPERYQYFVPLDATFFLSIYDDWGRRKLNYFKSLGLDVHILWEVPPEQKGISASEIRRRMLAGLSWRHLVPACIPSLMEQWSIPDRLKRLDDAVRAPDGQR